MSAVSRLKAGMMNEDDLDPFLNNLPQWSAFTSCFFACNHPWPYISKHSRASCPNLIDQVVDLIVLILSWLVEISIEQLRQSFEEIRLDDVIRRSTLHGFLSLSFVVE